MKLKPRKWHKILDQALWASRNSPRESTNTTPFRLTFGHDDAVPAEICLQSTRFQRQFEVPTDHYWNMILDEFVDLDEERLKALAKSYNKKVKSKTFATRDLVWKVILPMGKKIKALGKWSRSWEGPWKILIVFCNNAYEVKVLVADNRIMSIKGKYFKKYRPLLQEVKITLLAREFHKLI